MGNASGQPDPGEPRLQGCNSDQAPFVPGTNLTRLSSNQSQLLGAMASHSHYPSTPCPPPMMLSGATPIRGPAPIPIELQHLYKQPGSGSGAGPSVEEAIASSCQSSQSPYVPGLITEAQHQRMQAIQMINNSNFNSNNNISYNSNYPILASSPQPSSVRVSYPGPTDLIPPADYSRPERTQVYPRVQSPSQSAKGINNDNVQLDFIASQNVQRSTVPNRSVAL